MSELDLFKEDFEHFCDQFNGTTSINTTDVGSAIFTCTIPTDRGELYVQLDFDTIDNRATMKVFNDEDDIYFDMFKRKPAHCSILFDKNTYNYTLYCQFIPFESNKDIRVGVDIEPQGSHLHITTDILKDKKDVALINSFDVRLTD